MVDSGGFVLGETIAATPGTVVSRNEMLELIQYTPQTDEVQEVPVLVVPPTINNYYALDLAPERSLVEYGVRQGRQMFLISWRNPDLRHASWNLETYVRAVLDALDAVEEAAVTGRSSVGRALGASSRGGGFQATSRRGRGSHVTRDGRPRSRAAAAAEPRRARRHHKPSTPPASRSPTVRGEELRDDRQALVDQGLSSRRYHRCPLRIPEDRYGLHHVCPQKLLSHQTDDIVSSAENIQVARDRARHKEGGTS